MMGLFKRRERAQQRDPFLTLRAAVEASCKAPSVILISSVLPGDGKTTVSAGLAVALAKSGYATMAIDAGSTAELTKALGVKGGSAGVRRAAEHLDVMRIEGGDLRVSSTAELRRTFDQLRERYAYIVLDGCELSSGGLAAAAAVDGVLLTVRSGRATVDEDAQATRLLDHCRARFIGVIATRGRGDARRGAQSAQTNVRAISGSIEKDASIRSA
jgi:Mrp family chromosome partitioning ATPase